MTCKTRSKKPDLENMRLALLFRHLSVHDPEAEAKKLDPVAGLVKVAEQLT